MQFCKWLENTWLISTLSNSVILSTVIELTHYFSLFLLVGSIALVDLRILGLAARSRKVIEMADELFPWMWTGLAFNSVSGFLLFAGDATAFFHNWIFHIKLEVILLAVISGVVLQRNVRRWDQSETIPISAKFLAFVSLALWIGSILASVELPALTGVG